MRKKIIISISLWALILGIIFVGFNTLNIRDLKGQINKEKMPANEAFEDADFYSCVVYGYLESISEENPTEAYSMYYDSYEGSFDMLGMMEGYDSHKVYLDDEALSKIKSLSCTNVNSTKGIEKLINLDRIEIEGAFDSIDLSNNKELTYIQIYSDNLTKIGLSNNTKLDNVYIRGKNLTELDTSKLTDLKWLYIDGTNINKIDLLNNSSISTVSFPDEVSEISIPDSSINRYFSGFRAPVINLSDGKRIEYSLENMELRFNYSRIDFILKNKDIGVSELKNNNYLKLKNLSVMICPSNTKCDTEVTDEEGLEGKYALFLDNDGNVVFTSAIQLFYSDYFEDYNLYKEIVDLLGYSSTSQNLTEEELNQVTNVSAYDVYSTKGIEKLTNLTNLNISGSFKDIDLSKNTKLTNVTLVGSFKNVDLSKNTELTELSLNSQYLEKLNLTHNPLLTSVYVGRSNLISIDLSNNNLIERLYIDSDELQELDISNLTNLNSLFLTGNGIKTLDLSNNNKITSLDISVLSLEEIKGLNDLQLDSIDLYAMGLKKLDISGNTNVNSIDILSFELEELNLEGAKNLVNLMVVSPKLKQVKGIENLNLQMVFLPYSKLKELDLTNSANLLNAWVSFSELSKNEVYMLKGEEVELNENFKTRKDFIVDLYNEDDSIATYDETAKMITASDYGQTTLTRYYPGVDLNSGDTTYYPLKTYINVYDIKSTKFDVNKKSRYIYAGTETNDKAIKRYVKVYGENAKKKLEDNKFYLLKDDKVLNTFDIVKVSSKKYDMNSNEIKYSDEFNMDDITVINAEKQVIDNELQIVYKGEVIRTFKLTKEGK